MSNFRWVKKRIKKYMPESITNLLRLAYYESNKHKKIKEAERIIDNDYYANNLRHINWNKPVSYTEKLNFAKLYSATTEKTMLTDKLLVREWVKEIIGEEYLIPLYGVYNEFKEIDFSELPEQFVIKCNHDSGSTTIINQNELSEKKLKLLERQYNGFYLKRNYAYKFFEMHYYGIKPRILVEH